MSSRRRRGSSIIAVKRSKCSSLPLRIVASAAGVSSRQGWMWMWTSVTLNEPITSTPGKGGWTLLEERAHSFHLVFTGEAKLEERGLELEPFRECEVQGRARRLLRGRHGHGTLLRDLVGDRERARQHV